MKEKLGGMMDVTTSQKRQFFKFGMYGLLKNLRFFEPFLLVYFLQSELSLFQIGILYSIREAIVYIFEIPSGVFADRYGRKTELIICFLFYIISFVFFFFGKYYVIFMIGMALYGFGEAFRSGTHKAMIMSYLDYYNIKESKGKVYGMTRSYSLIGTMISSLLAAVFILVLPEIRLLFLLALIPYTFDAILILSYPSYLNAKQESSFSFKVFMRQNIQSVRYVMKDRPLRKLLLRSSIFMAGYKTLRDYIQPIVVTTIGSVVLFEFLSKEDNTLIIIPLMYAVFAFFSAIATKNAYRLQQYHHTNRLIQGTWLLSAIMLFIMGLWMNTVWLPFIGFTILYVIYNIRKPFMVELIGNASKEDKRASVLSIESQSASILIIILAPIFGYIADQFSIPTLFILIGSSMIILFILQVLFQPFNKNVKQP